MRATSARKRWGTWLAVALVAGLAALAGWQRAALAEGLAHRWLAARGVPASLHVERLGLGGLVVTGLRLGEDTAPDLEAARVALAWSWRGLVERRLDRVELEGVRLSGRLGDGGLELGALDALGGDGAAPAGLPFAEARFRDVEVALDSPRGQLVLRAAEGSAATAAPGSREVTGSAELSASAPFASAVASLRLAGTLDAPRLALSGTLAPDEAALGVRAAAPVRVTGEARLGGSNGVEADVTVEAEQLALPALASFADLAVEGTFAGGELTAELRVGRLAPLTEPPLFAPLAVDAALRGAPAKLALRGTARTDGDGFALPFDGTLEPFVPRARVGVRVPETELALPAREPADLFPWLADAVLRAQGRAAGELALELADGRLTARAELALRDVDLRTTYATLRRVNGVVTLLGPEPLVTPPAQRVAIGLVEGPLPLSNGLLRFELRPGRTLDVAEGVFRLAGGTLSFSGSFPLDAEERTLVLRAEGLSVAQLLSALDFEGLSGTGRLAGRLVVEQRGERVRIATGELRATQPGVIRYAAGPGAGAVAAEQPQLGTALGALEDLRYETLELEVSGDVSELDVKVHARGSNPNFQEGRPVVLNVNVEAPVDTLLRAGLATYRVPEEIEAQVNRYFEREAR